MKLNNKYCLTENNGKFYLADIEDGDVFLIDDVVKTIIEFSVQHEVPRSLAAAVYTRYKDTDGDCSESELMDYIEHMVADGFLIN